MNIFKVICTFIGLFIVLIFFLIVVLAIISEAKWIVTGESDSKRKEKLAIINKYNNDEDFEPEYTLNEQLDKTVINVFNRVPVDKYEQHLNRSMNESFTIQTGDLKPEDDGYRLFKFPNINDALVTVGSYEDIKNIS